MTFPMVTLLAQTGLGDAPDLMLIMMLSLWPYHISSALGLTRYMTLIGYGPAAVAFQSITLLFLFVGLVLIARSPRRPRWLKAFLLVVGYPIAVFGTNVIPGLFYLNAL